MYHTRATLRNSQGATLIIGLLTLVLLSLIGIAATTTSRMEVQIAGNDKMYKEAFYAAEFGVTQGEAALEALLSRTELNEDSVVGHYAQGNRPALEDLQWDTSDSVKVPAANLPDALKVAAPPNYTIVQRRFTDDSLTRGIGVPTGVYQFRVASRGVGSNPTAESIIETIYAKRFD
jgi:type IV pilus assembly protein PilX